MKTVGEKQRRKHEEVLRPLLRADEFNVSLHRVFNCLAGLLQMPVDGREYRVSVILSEKGNVKSPRLVLEGDNVNRLAIQCVYRCCHRSHRLLLKKHAKLVGYRLGYAAFTES